MVLKKFFPFQITKRIYLFGILVITIPVMLITAGTQLHSYNHQISDKTQTLYSVAKLLDMELAGNYIDILNHEKAINKPQKEQIMIVNKALQPKINRLTDIFPDVGMGYYSLELQSRVALGPNFNLANLKPIPPGSPYMKAYDTGKPLLQKVSNSIIWKGKTTLSLTYPIYRNGKIIGHVFTNAKLPDLYEGIFKYVLIIGLVGLAVTLVVLFISWKFFGRLKSELERFSEAVLKGKPAAGEALIPELTPVVELVQQHTDQLERVVARLTREISRRRDIEKKLKAANEKIINTIEGATDAFYALDNNLCFTYINGEGERQLSVKREDVLGRHITDVFPDLGDVSTNYGKALKEQTTIRFQRFSRERNKWTEISVYPSGDEGLGVYCRDITEQKESHEKISFQANILDHVRNAVVATDPKGKIIFVNKYAEKLYGLYDDVIGKDISIIDVRPKHLMIHKKAVQTSILKNGYWEGDIEVVAKEGRIVPIHRIVTSIRNSDGSIAGIISVGIDLTERIKLEKEMARLDQLHMIGEMAAGIGHEVRNPMTTVRGFMQLLAAKEEDILKQERFNLMIEELDRANSIITEYLSLAKNKKVALKPKNINNILSNLYPLLQADAMVSDKYIKTELQKIPDLLLDEKEISQLVINLVRNGLEAMDAGGTVTLKTYLSFEGDVVLAVEDHGHGIDPGVVDRIGTPFVTTKDAGTGLGLAVSYSIAGRHNAKIDVETGKAGTTFYVRFGTAEESTNEHCYSNVI